VLTASGRTDSVRGVRILILGGSGMLGRKLARRLTRDGTLGRAAVEHLTVADVVAPAEGDAAAAGVETVVADVAAEGVAEQLVASRPDVVFQLAAVVSGEAELDLDAGYRVNLDGMRRLLDAVRAAGPDYRPRLVFSSSIAVFGAPLPHVIDDDHGTTPLTSYGTQKAMAELLLCDYTRRGFLDGVGIRLPTICVRPDAPNRAASGFFSSIVREPLAGREAVLPVSEDVRHWLASPRAGVGFLLYAATLDTRALGDRRCLTMPGLSVTVREQIAALRAVAGEAAVRRIRREPDADVMRIVAGWPRAFAAERASRLGFRADSDFTEIIRIHVEDELGGSIAGSAA
jgi:nucleoside-diphosphate-sugar epimerase